MDYKKDFSLQFKYTLKLSEECKRDGSNSFYESFIPFSINTLIQNELLSHEEEIFLSNYSGESSDNSEVEIPKNDSIKELDWINVDGEYEEICLFDYLADYIFLSELISSDDEQKSLKCGILTELITIFFLQFKIDFSILYNIYHDKELWNRIKTDVETAVDIVYSIVLRNFTENTINENKLTRRDLLEKLKKDPKDMFNKIFQSSFNEVQNKLEKIYINYVDENDLESLISIIKNNEFIPKKYKEKGDGCFCVIKNGNKLYFSLSGIQAKENKIPQKFLSSVTADLKQVLKMECDYCTVTTDMKAYGMNTELGFIYFPYSRPYPFSWTYLREYPGIKISHSLQILQKLYACCERKIFVKTNNTLPIKIFCRWSPCNKCMPAIAEEIQRHESFEYIALAKNFKTFYKYILTGNCDCKKLWRLVKE